MIEIDYFKYLEEEDIFNPNLEVTCFNEMEIEVNYVMSKIGSLIEQGVSLNKIYFYSIPSEYNLIIKKTMINHNIILDCKSEIRIYDTPIFKRYLDLLKDNSFVDGYKILNENTSYDPQDVLGSLIDLIIDVTSLKINKDEQIELLCFLAKTKNVQNLEYKESIKEIDDSYYLEDDEYCFMLGFSLGSHPVISKDTEFYLDSEKHLLRRNTSVIKNEISEEKLIRFIKRTKNLILTFKHQALKNVYYPSLLIKKLGIKEKKGKLKNVRYSKKHTLFEVSKYRDLERLYGVSNKWIDTFKNEELGFNTYDHLYKRINSFDKNQELVLSYTQIDDYMKCPFMYYLKHILHIDEFIGNFKTEIGTLFHNILEESNIKEINIDDYREEILSKFTTYKDRYFAEKVLPQVLRVIKKNNDFHNITNLNNISYEKEIKIKLDELSYLMGRIDKFLVDDISKTIAVVDYKTGKFTFDKKKVEFGLNLQLPIYALLLSKEYPDYLIAGVYIQKVLLEKDNIKDEEAYLLDGITINDLNLIKLIDPTLGTLVSEDGKDCLSSIYINKMKLNKDGKLNAYSPVIDIDEFLALIEKTKQHVEMAINGIRNANFKISPIDVKEEKNNACTYCKFADICNHDYNDTRYVSTAERKE